MAEKSPLVFVDGGFSQLPPGDSIEGLAYGSVTAGSGLVGGGDLSTGSKQVDVGLAASPSGVIFVGDSIGLDGVDVVLAGDAYSSGVAALEQADAALASGVAAQDLANVALASGNAALSAAVNFVDPTFVQFTAASAIASGSALGLDDSGRVQSLREVFDADTWNFGLKVVFESANILYTSATYDSTNNRVVIAYSDTGNFSYGTAIVGTVSGTSISFGTAVVLGPSIFTYTSTAYDSTNNRVVIAYRDAGNSSYGTAIVAAPDSIVLPTLSSQNNFIGIAQSTVASGTNLNVLLPRAVDYNQTGLTFGSFYYVDPTTNGFTTASGQPSTWSGAYNWSPVAKAVSSSGLLLLDTL